MMSVLQIVALIFSLFALSRVILRTKDSKLSHKEFVFWTSIWLSLLGVVFFPDYSTKFAEIIGLRRGVDVVIYSSIGILFYMLFRLYIKFEEREQEITKVVREIALLKKKNRKR